MHRFFVPAGSPGDGLVLTDREAHHAIHVLRLRLGETVATLNGEGRVRHCTVAGIGRERVELTIVQETLSPRLPCLLTLAQALPKGKTFESIVQKGTEIGATRIVPLITDRVVVELDADNGARKVGKWRQVAVEAAKQCGTPWLPEICEPTRFADFLLADKSAGLRVAGCLLPESRHLRSVLDQYSAKHGAPPGAVTLFIGPEGDFTPAEYHALCEADVHPVTLGPHVLRADTAAIYGLAILSYELISPSSCPASFSQ